MRHNLTTSQWIAAPVELIFAFFANPENLPRLMPKWQRTRIEEAIFAPPPPRPAVGSAAEAAANPATGRAADQATDRAAHLRSFAAGAGTTMTISFRPFPYSPIRIPWEVRILEFEWNAYFRDQQVRGPFAFWDQTHRTTAEARGGVAGTRVDDIIDYEVPFGPLGEIANTLFVARQIRGIFRYRQRRLHELLGIPMPV